MKKLHKEKALPKRRPLRKRKTKVDSSQATKIQAAVKEEVRHVDDQPMDSIQHAKRVSKGADEEME